MIRVLFSATPLNHQMVIQKCPVLPNLTKNFLSIYINKEISMNKIVFFMLLAAYPVWGMDQLIHACESKEYPDFMTTIGNQKKLPNSRPSKTPKCRYDDDDGSYCNGTNYFDEYPTAESTEIDPWNKDTSGIVKHVREKWIGKQKEKADIVEKEYFLRQATDFKGVDKSNIAPLSFFLKEDNNNSKSTKRKHDLI